MEEGRWWTLSETSGALKWRRTYGVDIEVSVVQVDLPRYSRRATCSLPKRLRHTHFVPPTCLHAPLTFNVSRRGSADIYDKG